MLVLEEYEHAKARGAKIYPKSKDMAYLAVRSYHSSC